jgi:hypothetical protein
MAHKYHNPEVGKNINWFGDHLGLCDSYKKNNKTNS